MISTRMKTMQLFTTCIAALAALPLIIGASLPAAAAAEPYDINVVLSQTGTFAFLGKEETVALKAIETRVNSAGGVQGRPVRFVFADDQSTPQIAVQLANALQAKGVPVMLGPAATSTCQAVVPVVATKGPVEYCFSPGNIPPAGSYAFSATASPVDVGTILVRYFHRRGWNKIAFLYATDATGQQAEKNFDRTLLEPDLKDVQYVAREHFNPTDLNVTAQITKIKASDAQAIIAFTTGGGFATILRGLKDVGVTLPVGTSNGNISYDMIKSFSAFMPDNVYFPSVTVVTGARKVNGPTRDAQLALIETYRGAGMNVDFINQSVWDPAMIVIDALRKLGPSATAEQLHAYLMNLHGWIGTYGAYDFHAGDQRGIGSNALVVDRWDVTSGKFVAASQPGGQPL
jgi:branched-chain amino acid transport system substrate-binding protein